MKSTIQLFKSWASALLIVALTLTVVTSISGQTDWTKYDENPILNPGPPDSWDDESIVGCTVLFIDNIYHMWYSGYDGNHFRIGYATSTDGTNWTKYENNPVLDMGDMGSWDDKGVSFPVVLKINSTFHIWYSGDNVLVSRIGHATSEDGKDWTKDESNPVLDIGDTGTWEEMGVFPMPNSILFEDGEYKMWYGGKDGSMPPAYAMGYASSADGRKWTRYEQNPVMVPSAPPSFDMFNVVPGPVISDNNLYHMWFSGSSTDYKYQIGYATSVDGFNWEKDSSNNPVLEFGSVDTWDFIQAWSGSVLFDSNSQLYKMWYTGGDFFAGQIGYATAPKDPDYIDNKLNTSIRLHCYPNPFHSDFTIEYELEQKEKVVLRLLNPLGQIIHCSTFEGSQGKNKVIWNSSDYPKGLYHLTIQVGYHSDYTRLVRF